MGWAHVERKGPVLIVSCHRVRAVRLRELLEADRYEVAWTDEPAEAERLLEARAPTVVVIDWEPDAEVPLDELVHRFRPRRSGARLVVVAEGAAARALEGSPAVRAVVSPRLDAEELIDAVWSAHHQCLDARQVQHL